MAMIETGEALDNLDQMLDVDGCTSAPPTSAKA